MYLAIKWLELFIQLLEAYPSFFKLFSSRHRSTYVLVIDMVVSFYCHLITYQFIADSISILYNFWSCFCCFINNHEFPLASFTDQKPASFRAKGKVI